MFGFIFERIYENPLARFRGSELLARGPEQFGVLVESGVLVQVGTAEALVVAGRRLEVRELPEGGWEAIDDEDLESDAVSLASDDVEMWAVDVAKLAALVATENDLRPEVSQLSDRLWYLGPCATRTAAVLALLPAGDAGLACLRTLPSLLPRRINRAVVLAGPTGVPMMWQKELEGLGIEIVSLELPSMKAVPALRTSTIRLNADLPVVLRHEPSGLTLSSDLRKVRLAQREWSLSFTCGRAVEYMIRALNDGQAALHQAAILEAAESATSDLKTLFHRSDAIGTLIVGTGVPGFYRLNVESTPL